MAGEWRTSTWGEEVSLEYGKALRDYNTKRGNFRVFGSNGPIGWTDTPLAPGPGVILGRKGANRGVEFSRKPFFVIDTAYYLVPKADLDMQWLYYAVKHHKLGEIDDGSPIPSTTRSAVYVRDINVPPLPTQRAIASVLGTLDDLIELNRETNEILEEMARALFKSWFVDFDPVRRNKEEGRRMKDENADSSSFTPHPSAFDHLFPDHFEDSELGQIPRGWEVVTVSDLCEINGWTLGKRDELPRLEYVEISEVKRGEIGEMPVYRRGEEPSRARRRLRHGDTVMSTVRPDRGAYFLALNPPTDRVASTGFAVLSPSGAPWSFLHAALTQPEVFDRLGHLADGGAYPAIRPEIIGAIQIAKPDNEAVLQAFHDVCAPIFEMMEDHRHESRDLAALRDTLLPKLLSGELRVSELDAVAAAG